MVSDLWENIFKKSEQKSISSLLSENILFENLSKRELKFVEQIIHLRHYQASEPIFRQNEIGIGMYIIASGSVTITINDPSSSGSEEIRQAPITQLSSGDFFGELSLVETNGRRTASAIANKDTTLIGFFKPDLLEIAKRSPSTGIKIIMKLSEVLGERLKQTTTKIGLLRKEVNHLKENH